MITEKKKKWNVTTSDKENGEIKNPMRHQMRTFHLQQSLIFFHLNKRPIFMLNLKLPFSMFLIFYVSSFGASHF